ncbi:hypothetical protein M9Y10_008930 [Tritrichomonas musculus]|uniref:Amino acid permease family protein n=1 Tax=Tritrichomonas musculus TaxID=1915356 RepID=A0ABR2IZF1_9EUKA
MRKHTEIELQDISGSNNQSQNKKSEFRDQDGNPSTIISYSFSENGTDQHGNPSFILEDMSASSPTIHNPNNAIGNEYNPDNRANIRTSNTSNSPSRDDEEKMGVDPNSVESNNLNDFRNEKASQSLLKKVQSFKSGLIPKNGLGQQNLHWFIGVFIPVFLNMLCVTYFMDLHRSIKHIGWGLGFLFYTISIFVSIGTLVGICVIATNGEMKDGGCYYLISRTLGPEIGGAIGITLVIAHGISISHRLHYISACIDSFYSGSVTISERWDRTLWHIILSVIVLLLCLPGLKFVMYFLPVLAALLVIAVVSIYLGFFIRKPGDPTFFTGLSLKTLTDNFDPGNYSIWDYLQFLGVLFPSANAVMTCANFSGNLRPVGRAIPIGAFSAIFICAFVICSTFLFQAGSFNFDGGNDQPTNGTTVNTMVSNLTIIAKDSIKFSHIADINYSTFDASIMPILTYIGFICSCIGSAITLNIGGARILAKMIEDKLMPSFLKALFFRGEPFGCNCIVAFIGVLFAFVDDPTTATLITNIIFSIPFALVNFSVWTCASANYPGFRPSFRFYNKWTALLLSIICFARMFLMNWVYALISLPIYLIIWFIYHKLKPADTWGTVTQSRYFYSTLKEELNLYHIKPHVKTFRPNIILISTKHPDDERDQIDFLNQLLHGHGMAAIGRVFISENAIDFSTLVNERDGTYVTGEAGYQAFYDVTVAETFAEGVRDLLLLMGIGMMRPNTICLSFPEGWTEGKTVAGYLYDDFYNAIAMAFDANYSLTVLRNIELYSQVDRKGTIDVWWLIDDGGLSLLLPYLLSRHKTWKKAKLRLIMIANTDDGNDLETQEKKMATLLYKFRINAEPVVIEISMSSEVPTPMAQTQWNNLASTMNFHVDQNDEPRTHQHLVISDLVREYSSSASFVFLTMVVPNSSLDPKILMAWLEILSSIKVPFCFVRGNGENTLSWTV